VFFELLANTMSFPRAQMTGKVRLRGEGGFGLLVGGIIGGFHHALDSDRKPVHWFAQLVLKLGGNQP
jgi:hypothetical protein